MRKMLWLKRGCDSGRLAGDAQAALRTADHPFLDCGHRGPNVLHSLCSCEVRYRGVDGVAHAGDRPVRNPHDAGRARFFPHRLLTNDSTTYAQPSIDDYAERTREIVAAWKTMDGTQGGDPAKLADALVKLVALKEPPARFAAGADAVQTFEIKANTLLAQGQAHRELSSSLAY
jgi:hypothetical protein